MPTSILESTQVMVLEAECGQGVMGSNLPGCFYHSTLVPPYNNNEVRLQSIQGLAQWHGLHLWVPDQGFEPYIENFSFFFPNFPNYLKALTFPVNPGMSQISK
ncbi:hypothetical protein VNO77_19279 [Canavalia gladiata]|uniref:Uncharacterized protein n=1 Tax=Canavalia gladiata TaxID=3824 RepID=A0AAN9LM70_CANGL